MKMKTKQSHIKKLNIIEIEISKLIKENEKLKVENRKLREKLINKINFREKNQKKYKN